MGSRHDERTPSAQASANWLAAVLAEWPGPAQADEPQWLSAAATWLAVQAWGCPVFICRLATDGRSSLAVGAAGVELATLGDLADGGALDLALLREHGWRLAPVREEGRLVLVLGASGLDEGDPALAIGANLCWQRLSRWRAEQALAIERQRYARMLETATDGYLMIDRQARFLGCSEAAAAMLGYTAEEMRRIGLAEVEAVESPDEIAAHLALIQSGGPTRFETRMYRRDGSLVDIEISVSYFAPQGIYLSFMRDISAQRAAAAALAASQERFAKAFQLSPDAININRLADGQYMAINEGFTTITGYAPEDVLGRSSMPGDLGIWMSAEDRQKLVDGLRERGEVIGLEARFRRKDGQQIIGLMSARLIELDGQPCILSISRDISDRYAAQAAIQEEKERLRVTVESIGDGVIAADTDGRVVLANPVAAELLGCDAGQLVGLPLDEALAPLGHALSDRDPDGALAEVLRSATTRPALVSLPEPSGDQRIVGIRVARIEAQGEPRGSTLVLRDLTGEYRLRDEMHRIARLDSLGILAGGIAHDFNNLLTAVAGHADLAERALAERDLLAARQHLSEVAQAGTRARGLTQQLLTFAKGGAPVRETSALQPIIDHAVSLALAGSNCRAVLDVSADLWAVHADRAQLEQVLHNLLLNAAQAMPEGGDIVISASNAPLAAENALSLAAGRYVALQVRDTGSGIAPELLTRIFDPFFTTKAQGCGLGLASVHSIVRAHGGHIGVTSEPGKGARFDILLPATDGVAQATVPDPPESNGAAALRILVLDDEAAIGRMLQRMLSQMGHKVIVTADGATAVQAWHDAAAQNLAFDLGIFDLTVPGGMGGLEVLAALREQGFQPVVVASSGYATGSVMAEWRHHGFAGCLAKPYRRDDVLELLGRLAARQAC